MPDFSILTNNIDMYLEGFKYTVMSSVVALIGSFVLGIIMAVMRISPIRILNWIGSAYVEFVRNIPLVLIAFIFYFALPVIGITFNGVVAGTVALTVYTAAFIAEVIRAGILSVAKGQMEAARSSGLTYTQAMYHVVLPQAMKIVIPPLGNQFLNLVKNSSILGIIAGTDLMYQGDLISTKTLVTFDVYIFVGMFYLVLTIPLSMLVRYLERRLAKEGV
ncbi:MULTISPECIES: amino acid ABC transporter permease [Bacillus]|uniref:His/Glu/Gln/Arg/opine family amino ABC transporter, permease, 3-TM region n=2 Tax=Bacillus cereus group TaxID=86661 RepID=R8QXI7_BACCE|nr:MULTISPECIES: amino acid ABC transporter permease [Bacillus cereus group]EOP75791.1 His/Glu/Gln/Arg/opine family amino ABC transporter, permease, 3-TM region [Bacillus cereus VD118]MBJ8094731.1 amino acid ABC transporter permease [Bacillus cereus]MCQ6356995.1 amino acid ABC transporter permease [Bacillus cereus]CAH2463476.1 ABC transporter [Bacillus mycoides KBAB4]SCB66622.1 Glutamine ABC transporter permease protein GlnM [Bacillus mycoides]